MGLRGNVRDHSLVCFLLMVLSFGAKGFVTSGLPYLRHAQIVPLSAAMNMRVVHIPLQIDTNMYEELVCSISGVPRHHIIRWYIAKVENEDILNFIIQYQFNEMYMMNIAYKKNPELINILPSLPFNSQPMLFDPGDYGIFLEGNDFNENISTITLSNDIGKYIYDNLPNIDIDFVSNKPFLVQNDFSYQIFNLHIHQKNLEKYSFN